MSAVSQPQQVAAVFQQYPPELRTRLLELRALILKTARDTPGVGEIEETLKWGQPSYLTPQTKSGTTIRIDADSSDKGDYALYVNCKSSLVENWREQYPHMTYGGVRSVHFKLTDELPAEEVAHCIAMALTYHTHKKSHK